MRIQPSVAGVLAIVVVTTLVSGPLVSLVDLTSSESFSGATMGEGRVTVGDVTFPDRVAFERGEFGAGTYYLRIPAATAQMEEISGRPIAYYRLHIPELNYRKSVLKVLSPADEGPFRLTVEETAFSPDRFDVDSYAGQLAVDVRYGGRERVVATKNVTVEVVG